MKYFSLIICIIVFTVGTFCTLPVSATTNSDNDVGITYTINSVVEDVTVSDFNISDVSLNSQFTYKNVADVYNFIKPIEVERSDTQIDNIEYLFLLNPKDVDFNMQTHLISISNYFCHRMKRACIKELAEINS